MGITIKLITDGELIMKIKEIMSDKPHYVSPDTNLQEAAQLMRDHNFGFIPVGKDDRLIGMVTDRDIAIRAVAEGWNPQETKVSDIMTKKVLYCYEDDDLIEAAKSMRKMHVRRLIVLNKDKWMVGVISLADLASKGQDEKLCGQIEKDLSHRAAV